MKKVTMLSLLFMLTGVSACSESDKQSQGTVSQGQLLWQENCAVCHQQGLGGAPMIGNKKQWGKRVTQGLPTLIEHALTGYSGETGEMPPRGGNENLTDEEVKLAVTYMVSKVQN